MSGRKLADILECGAGRQYHPKGEDLIQGLKIQFSRDLGIRKDRLDLGCKRKAVFRLCVEQRPDAKPVTRHEELLLCRIPDRECPLPVQAVNAALAFFLIQMQDDFCVRPRGELVAFLNQLISQFDVVEDFTIERDRKPSVGGGHGLTAALDVNDAQPGMSQACWPVAIEALRIGSAMRYGCDHHAQSLTMGHAVVGLNDSCYSAHKISGTAIRSNLKRKMLAHGRECRERFRRT